MPIFKDRIQFDVLNPKRIYLLCPLSPQNSKIKNFFELQGYEVKETDSPQEIFQVLEKGNLAPVLISRELPKALVTQVSGFLQRKFKIPVLIFGPVANNTPENRVEKTGLTPEILHLKSDINPEILLSEV